MLRLYLFLRDLNLVRHNRPDHGLVTWRRGQAAKVAVVVVAGGGWQQIHDRESWDFILIICSTNPEQNMNRRTITVNKNMGNGFMS